MALFLTWGIYEALAEFPKVKKPAIMTQSLRTRCIQHFSFQERRFLPASTSKYRSRWVGGHFFEQVQNGVFLHRREKKAVRRDEK